MSALLATEWLKLRTVRSTYYILGVIAAFAGLGLLLTWYTANLYDNMPPGGRVALSSPAQLACWVAQLCLGVLGALTITNEYATGMIRLTLGAMPRRRTVLAAKAGVLAAVALPVGQVVAFATELPSRWIAGDRPLYFNASSLADDVPVLLASGLSVVVVALLGLALGAVLRSAAGAIVTLFLLWYVVPIVALNLPDPWSDRLNSVMLTSLPQELAGAAPAGNGVEYLLSPLAALLAMLAWALIPLGLAAIPISRRDA